jgi:kynurenine formamidase
MPIHDLTHVMHSLMPVYPGKENPVITPAATIETEGYREMRLEIDGHTGTHIDAPAHMLKNGLSLDAYPIDKFTGRAVIVPVAPSTKRIGIADLLPWENEFIRGRYVLLHTGWSKYWSSDEYLRNYPVLTEEAATWLTSFGLDGIGVDTISVDPVQESQFPVHYILLSNDLLIIENLKFPAGLDRGIGTFCCFPIHYADADGAPVRAVFID